MRTRTTLLPTCRRLFSTTHIRRDVVDLAYTRHEPSSSSSTTAAPIILMHGLFGSQRNNRTFILAKELNRAVYTIDLRNHGASPHHPVHTYTSLSQDVESFIDAHSIPSPTLIGHSMGAKVAMVLALRRPNAYSGIVPVDNAPVDAALKSDFGTYVKAMQEIERHQPRITKQSEADQMLQKYEPSLPIRQFLLTNLVKDSEAKTGEMKFRVPLGILAKSLGEMADFPFKDPDTARYEGPTLVIRGGNSRYVADETLPVVGRFFPRFELVDVPDAGHWVIAEKFDECVNAVVEWAERLGVGERT